MNIKEEIIKAKMWINKDKHHPFFGYLLFLLKTVENSNACPTIGTDGECLYYNEGFMKKMSKSEIRGLMLHEVMHLAMGHLWRRGPRHPTIWNIACFHPKTYISGKFENIENLKIGDNILQDKKEGQIIETFKRKYNGDLLQIKGMGMLPIKLTPEHPILVYERKYKNTVYPIRLLTKPKWIKAKDLKSKKHYLVIPRYEERTDIEILNLEKFINKNKTNNHEQSHNIKKTIKKGLILNQDIAWLMGLYVAEGSKINRFNDGMHFSLGSHENKIIKKIERINKKYLNYKIRKYYPRKSTVSVDLSSRILSKAFEKWFGRGAHNKKIPDFILYHKNKDIISSFINGYMDGDGCQIKDNCVQGSTVSKTLVLQLQLLLARLGYMGTIRITKLPKRKIRNQILNKSLLYVIDWNIPKSTKRILNKKTIVSTSHRWKKNKKYIITPIVDIKKNKYSGYVYNLATENHTYLAENIVVHNCDIVINNEISKYKNISLPTGVLIDHKYDGWFVEQVYKDLKKNMKMKTINIGVGKGGFSKNKKNQSCRGSHSKWNKKLKSKSNSAKMQRKWKRAVQQAADIHKQKQKGDLPLGIQRIVEENQPKVHWKEVLLSYISEDNTDYSYRRPDRRFLTGGFIMPDLIDGEKLENIVIAVDCSGSIGEQELKEFSGEVRGILKSVDSVQAWICSFDTQIYSFKEINDYQVKIEYYGGGGTDTRPVFSEIKKRGLTPKVLIIFSDLYADYPPKAPDYDVIWLAPKRDHGDPPKWGRLLTYEGK